MKQFISIALLFLCSCKNYTAKDKLSWKQEFVLPGIPSENTLYFHGNNLYYESMDGPKNNSFKCYSFTNKNIIWIKAMGELTGINSGAITTEDEYVVPTLSDTVFLINDSGITRILKLQERCKINPLIYKTTFILQDRGVGLKCFDAATLQQLWLIKQESDFTMSQPVLQDSNIIYILDEKKIQSSNASTGKLNWSIEPNDSLTIHTLYGSFDKMLFVLSTDLEKEKILTAIDSRNGHILWKQKVDTSIDVWKTSMTVANGKLYCKGDSTIYIYSAIKGTLDTKQQFTCGIATNIIEDGFGNILLGLNNKRLVRIDKKNKVTTSEPLSAQLNRLYKVGDKIYLYCYPNFYQLDTPVLRSVDRNAVM